MFQTFGNPSQSQLWSYRYKLNYICLQVLVVPIVPGFPTIHLSTLATPLCLLAFSVWTFYDVLFRTNASCFVPNGDIADGYEPCNNTISGGHSACCNTPNPTCSTNGYCMGNAGFMYRGACTDISWLSSSCPLNCRNSNTPSMTHPYQC